MRSVILDNQEISFQLVFILWTMDSILSTLGIGQERNKVTCCIEYSIVDLDVALSFLHTLSYEVYVINSIHLLD